MVDMDRIRELSDSIAREFHPERIILFGSYARGDARDQSDVDLLVIVPVEGHPAWKAVEIRRRTRPSFKVDLVVRSPEEVERRLALGEFFLQEIMEQGKVLYESADGRVGQESTG